MIDVTQADRDLLELIYSGTFKFRAKREKQALQEIAAHRIAAEKALLDRLVKDSAHVFQADGNYTGALLVHYLATMRADILEAKP